jgi:hypothetical protein
MLHWTVISDPADICESDARYRLICVKHSVFYRCLSNQGCYIGRLYLRIIVHRDSEANQQVCLPLAICIICFVAFISIDSYAN